MLFNSYVFLFAFLPLTLAAYYLARGRFGHQAGLGVLACASLIFYAWWGRDDLQLLLGYPGLLLTSIAANYLAGRSLEQTKRRWLLVAAIAGNLGVLAFFKYFNFFLDNLRVATGAGLGLLEVALPLGISFFTFEQITFLVDVWRGRTRLGGFLSYAVFVGFFPHLIAGPIVQHRDLGGQLQSPERKDDVWFNLGAGLSIFAVGLAKKVLLADTFAPFASGVFDAADRGSAMPMGAAWTGALAYAFQIFFDFSGYSDMAIGLARMLGYQLPVNFDAPYRSTSIVEFWRRWHISLSTFLRDYLYIPLGGNRLGEGRRYLNLMVTMLLGGLWHGAGWNYVAWGGLHGVYLVAAHLWSKRAPANPGRVRKAMGWVLTMLAVLIAWVFFRAKTFAGAALVLKAMAGLGVQGGGASPAELGWIALGLALVLLVPDTARLFGAAMSEVDGTRGDLDDAEWLKWRPSPRWALGGALMLAWAVLHLPKVSEFIYYQF